MDWTPFRVFAYPSIMRPVLLATLLSILALPAPAAEFAALLNKRLDVNCHEGKCEHLVIEKVEQVGASDGGAGKLYVVVTEGAETGATGAEKKGDAAHVAFVFCSRTRPSVFYPSTDGSSSWAPSYLRPNVGDDINDANGASYLIYFASCHHAAVTGPEQIMPLAKRLGYRVKVPEATSDRTVPTPFTVIMPKETR